MQALTRGRDSYGVNQFRVEKGLPIVHGFRVETVATQQIVERFTTAGGLRGEQNAPWIGGELGL